MPNVDYVLLSLQSMVAEMGMLKNKFENGLDTMIKTLDVLYKRSPKRDLPELQKVHVCDPVERMQMCKIMEMLCKTIRILNLELATMVH